MVTPEFLLTSLVVVLIPGTGVIYTISNGLFRGWRASIGAAFGCTLGIIPHLTASILGLSALLHMSSVAFQVVKLAGAAYLIFLAITMWRECGSLQFNSKNIPGSSRKIIVTGFLINILNPKLSLFFLAFLPLFVQTGTISPLVQMSILSLIFMVMTLIIFIVYGLCANGVRHYVVNSPQLMKWLQKGFAALFGGLGLKLALSE